MKDDLTNNTIPANDANLNDNTDFSGDANDQECLQIIESRDYYGILNISKEASDEEIKKAYKKVIIKYHPDKNKSEHSTEAFKKVSHAFQVLSDSEKRAFYDHHGTQEEYNERMENETNEFDLFDSVFNGRNVRRKKANKESVSIKFALIQLGFTLAMFYFYNFFLVKPTDKAYQTNFFKFEESTHYPFESRTTKNNIVYYYNDLHKMKLENITEEEENTINEIVEKSYLSYLSEKCQNSLRNKYEIEYKLALSSDDDGNALEEELDNIDYSYCDNYEDLKEKLS